MRLATFLLALALAATSLALAIPRNVASPGNVKLAESAHGENASTDVPELPDAEAKFTKMMNMGKLDSLPRGGGKQPRGNKFVKFAENLYYGRYNGKLRMGGN
ncbi:hypothetical protein H2199_001104 [Coniosporium tulheliwenetii]|uniref:Uncharacterized protein n=1 Tax=Coniosporium tulheliwenetii TaxID=3383036 RepID=A0ACC2ZLC9_9PEZI|nr:hypothetical protein H2199_001104 [Cladosporium sp. JES 115]